MPECLPFCGWIYNLEKIKIDEVVAPQYDIVTSEEIEYFKKKNLYNIFHLELPDSYHRAKELIKNWIEEKILIQNKKPGIYFYELEFFYENKKFVRKGFILLVKISPFEEGKILPHEKTFAELENDRFELLKATNFQFSQIFALYEDPHLETIKSIRPQNLLYEISFFNEKHRIYKISEKETIKKILQFLGNKTLYIADGHHRYVTALKFKKYMESIYGRNSSKDYNYIPMYLCPLEDENLLILPTHRIYYFSSEFIEKFSNFAILERVLDINEIENLNKYLSSSPQKLAIISDHTFKIFNLKNEIYQKIKQKDSLLSEISLYNFLEVLNYLEIKEEVLRKKELVKCVASIYEVINHVKKGAIGVIFPSISKEIFKKISQAKKLMPHKCTYFYPKILTGVVLYEIKGEKLNYNGDK